MAGIKAVFLLLVAFSFAATTAETKDMIATVVKVTTSYSGGEIYESPTNNLSIEKFYEVQFDFSMVEKGKEEEAAKKYEGLFMNMITDAVYSEITGVSPKITKSVFKIVNAKARGKPAEDPVFFFDLQVVAADGAELNAHLPARVEFPVLATNLDKKLRWDPDFFSH